MGTVCNKYEIRNVYRVLDGRQDPYWTWESDHSKLQVVKYIGVFYFSIRMHFVMFKGKCSL